MVKTIKVYDAVCPECGNKFETTKTENIQCGKILTGGSRCGTRFDL